MNIKLKILSVLLCICTLAGVVFTAVSCSDTSDHPKDTGNNPDGPVETGPLAGLDYDGKEFRIYSSTNAASSGMGNSNFMIEGDSEADGTDTIASAVDARNRNVENKLDVKLTFAHLDATWDYVSPEIENYITANIDEYDLIINDIFPLAELSIKNYFINTKQADSYFDFDQKYWYKEYMSDIAIHEDYQFILAGDFFIDVIRSAHCLIFNKSLYAETFDAPQNELYEIVADYEWTFELWSQLIKEAYVSTSGESGEVDLENDTFGLINCDLGGAMMPMITSGGCDYMIRGEDGYPTLGLDTGNASELAQAIFDIWWNEGAYSQAGEPDLLDIFSKGKALFVGYQRLGSLEHEIMRGIADDYKAVIPYPMLKLENKRYITSTHDTSEVGVIPTTIDDSTFPYISAVTEALCAETAAVVMPEYYETGLKVKYASDENAGAMIDIIHDNFGNVFQMAYDYSLKSIGQETFYISIKDQKNVNVASKLGKSRKLANSELNKLISEFKSTVVEGN